MPIDLSKATREELLTIHNEVLRNIAEQTKANLTVNAAAGHDSHSSNHSNNKIVDLQAQVANILRTP